MTNSIHPFYPKSFVLNVTMQEFDKYGELRLKAVAETKFKEQFKTEPEYIEININDSQITIAAVCEQRGENG